MSQILIYTFNARFNTSYKLLRSLDLPVDKAYIWGSTHIPKVMLQNIMAGKYTHILGLGDYRRNAKQVRIETCFVNQFGKRKIIADGDDFTFSTWQLPELAETITSDKTTTGPCNYSAYKLLSLIEQNHLPIKLAFMHIPSSSQSAGRIIAELISPQSQPTFV